MSTILYVESGAICREPIEAVLRGAGYDVRTAADGPEAMEALSTLTPGLILLDLALHTMDGLAVLGHIRSTPRLKGVPVVILTSVVERSRIIEAGRLGINAYIVKSQFSLRGLLARIQGLMPSGIAAPPSPPTGAAVAPPPAAQATGTAAAPVASAAGPTPAPGSGRAVVTRPQAMSRPAGARPAPACPAPAASAPPPVDAVEALKSLRPKLTRTELLERVKPSGDLKALSPAVASVLKLTGNARASVEMVARAIAQDHGIALKILKLANSAVYTRGEPVDSVQKAVVRIGVERIRQAVLNLSVVERFGSELFHEHLHTSHFWEHSIACGIIAAEIAHATSPKEADSSFTQGLLHDVGRVIYAEHLGQDYLDVLETAARLQLPVEQIESRMLLINHADLMEHVLQLWNFPVELSSPIVFHHLSVGNARSVDPRRLSEVMRLGLANRLAHAMMLGTSGNETVYPTEELCSALGLGAPVIEKIESETRRQTDDMKLAMLMESAGDGWTPRRELHRDAIGGPFNPLFVSETAPFDAHRIFCNSLATPSNGDPPNIAVVHIAGARHKAGAASRLRLMEQAAGVQNLPTLVLSPAGKLSLEEPASEGRVMASLATPFTVPRFIAAVRGLLALNAAEPAGQLIAA